MLPVVIVCLYLFGTCSGQDGVPTSQDCCLNSLCPYDCIRCDGRPTCYDLSDELGCDNKTDELLRSYPRPPILIPPVLDMIKEHLLKEKHSMAIPYPHRVCIRPPELFRHSTVTKNSSLMTTKKPVWMMLLEKLKAEAVTPPPTTTEAPVWLQLLRQLQADSIPTTASTTTPRPTTASPTTTTTESVLDAIIKWLQQRKRVSLTKSTFQPPNYTSVPPYKPSTHTRLQIPSPQNKTTPLPSNKFQVPFISTVKTDRSYVSTSNPFSQSFNVTRNSLATVPTSTDSSRNTTLGNSSDSVSTLSTRTSSSDVGLDGKNPKFNATRKMSTFPSTSILPGLSSTSDGTVLTSTSFERKNISILSETSDSVTTPTSTISQTKNVTDSTHSTIIPTDISSGSYENSSSKSTMLEAHSGSSSSDESTARPKQAVISMLPTLLSSTEIIKTPAIPLYKELRRVQNGPTTDSKSSLFSTRWPITISSDALSASLPSKPTTVISVGTGSYLVGDKNFAGTQISSNNSIDTFSPSSNTDALSSTLSLASENEAVPSVVSLLSASNISYSSSSGSKTAKLLFDFSDIPKATPSVQVVNMSSISPTKISRIITSLFPDPTQPASTLSQPPYRPISAQMARSAASVIPIPLENNINPLQRGALFPNRTASYAGTKAANTTPSNTPIASVSSRFQSLESQFTPRPVQRYVQPSLPQNTNKDLTDPFQTLLRMPAHVTQSPSVFQYNELPTTTPFSWWQPTNSLLNFGNIWGGTTTFPATTSNWWAPTTMSYFWDSLFGSPQTTPGNYILTQPPVTDRRFPIFLTTAAPPRTTQKHVFPIETPQKVVSTPTPPKMAPTTTPQHMVSATKLDSFQTTVPIRVPTTTPPTVVPTTQLDIRNSTLPHISTEPTVDITNPASSAVSLDVTFPVTITQVTPTPVLNQQQILISNTTNLTKTYEIENAASENIEMNGFRSILPNQQSITLNERNNNSKQVIVTPSDTNLLYPGLFSTQRNQSLAENKYDFSTLGTDNRRTHKSTNITNIDINMNLDTTNQKVIALLDTTTKPAFERTSWWNTEVQSTFPSVRLELSSTANPVDAVTTSSGTEATTYGVKRTSSRAEAMSPRKSWSTTSVFSNNTSVVMVTNTTEMENSTSETFTPKMAISNRLGMTAPYIYSTIDGLKNFVFDLKPGPYTTNSFRTAPSTLGDNLMAYNKGKQLKDNKKHFVGLSTTASGDAFTQGFYNGDKTTQNFVRPSKAIFKGLPITYNVAGQGVTTWLVTEKPKLTKTTQSFVRPTQATSAGNLVTYSMPSNGITAWSVTKQSKSNKTKSSTNHFNWWNKLITAITTTSVGAKLKGLPGDAGDKSTVTYNFFQTTTPPINYKKTKNEQIRVSVPRTDLTYPRLIYNGIDVKQETVTPQDIESRRECRLVMDSAGFCANKIPGYYKNPSDCRTFYVCKLSQRYMCHCPPNTLFDDLINVCNWDYNVLC